MASIRRFLPATGYLVLAAVLGLVGYWLMVTSFMVYDDEGYVLATLRAYLAEGHLYSRVYSQYGPFFYALHDGLHRLLALPITHDVGRMVALGHWGLVAALAGVTTWTLTRHHLAAMSAVMLTFLGLIAMVHEPSHPGGLIAALVMAGASAAAVAIRCDRPAMFGWVTGATGAALALTKINVGLFFLCASGAWLLVQTFPRRAGLVWVALGTALVPPALMASRWGDPWVMQFGFVFICIGIAQTPALNAASTARFTSRIWLAWAGAIATVAALTAAAVGLRGTSLTDLWEGVVLAPLRHPGAYFVPVTWPPLALVLAVVVSVTSLLLARRPPSERSSRAIAWARLLAAGWFLSNALSAETESMTRFAFRYGAILAPLMAIPLTTTKLDGCWRARVWLGWVSTWQLLHAYPVAGSQMAWGTLLWATVAVVGTAEALSHLGRERRAFVTAGMAACALLAAAGVYRVGRVGAWYHRSSESLGLPGATLVRPPDDLARQVRVLNANAVLHTPLLFSLPGMFSFNLWSGVPTPTSANVTHWFSLLNDAQQEAIVERLRGEPRAGLILNRYLLDFIAADGFVREGPLLRYLISDFNRAFKVGDYEFLIHKGRTIAPVLTARQFFFADGTRPKVQLTLPDLGGRRVAALRFQPLAGGRTVLHRIAPTPESPWEVEEINESGEAKAAARSFTAPLVLAGLCRVTLAMDERAAALDPSRTAILLEDADGRDIATVCFQR